MADSMRVGQKEIVSVNKKISLHDSKAFWKDIAISPLSLPYVEYLS